MLNKKLAIVAVIAALTCGEAIAKKKPLTFNWLEARETIQAPETGSTPPAFHAEDYDRYRKPGRAIITGVMRLTLPNGRQLPCEWGVGRHEAFLFPATKYTEWALERWTTLIDHRIFTLADRGWSFPGDNDPRIPMPPYLGFVAGTESIIGDVKCDNDGRFTFYNVPNGSYMVMGKAGIDREVADGDTSTESAVTTPDGMEEVLTEGHPSYRLIEGQQWIFVSIGGIVVTQPGTYEVKTSALKPAATYVVAN